jgi:hypothetical protein
MLLMLLFFAVFTNLVSTMHLAELAEADALKEHIHEVQVSLV